MTGVKDLASLFFEEFTICTQIRISFESALLKLCQLTPYSALLW